MSKRLYNAARAAAFAQQTGEVFLTLVEIEHDDTPLTFPGLFKL